MTKNQRNKRNRKLREQARTVSRVQTPMDYNSDYDSDSVDSEDGWCDQLEDIKRGRIIPIPYKPDALNAVPYKTVPKDSSPDEPMLD